MWTFYILTALAFVGIAALLVWGITEIQEEVNEAGDDY